MGLSLCAALLGLAFAGPAAADHDHRKVYVFSIDGLDPDAITSSLSPTLHSLVIGELGARTTFFENSRSVMFSETNPNHTAMITGAYGNRSGVNSNEYALYEEIPDEDSCAEPGAPRTAEPNVTAGESAACLEVRTIMDTLQRRKKPHHITTALVMGKPKLAGLFATKTFNGTDYDPDHIWTPCGGNENDYCDDSVPTQPITNYSAADNYPMDEVLRTVREGVPDEGRNRRPDYTFVNFPQVDSAGHVFGRNSNEYTTAIALIDIEIRRFIDQQKQLGLWNDTIMLIVSDHGMADTPFPTKVRIEDIFGSAGVPDDAYKVVGNAGSQAHVYLTNRFDPGRHETLKTMREALVAAVGVDEVYYRRPNPVDGGRRHTVRKQRPEWKLWGPRAGDIVVTSIEGVGVYETSEANSAPFNPFQGGHGNAATAKNTFFISGGHRAIRTKNSDADAVNADVAPTVMRLLSRRPPRSNQGTFRREAFKIGLLGPLRRP